MINTQRGPSPELVDKRKASRAHYTAIILTVLTAGILSPAATYIYYLATRGWARPFARYHIVQAVNIQITAFLLLIPIWILMLGVFSILLHQAVLIWAIVMHVQGLRNISRRNLEWRPRFCLQILR